MIILFVFDTQEECDKFLYIYDHYLKTIYYTIKRFTNDEYMIEDLSQDVLIKIAENLSHVDLNIPKRTRNYVITITRKYSLQGTTQGNGLTGGVPPVRFSM